MFTGWAGTWSNTALLAHSLLVMLPIIIVPFFLQKKYSDIPWQDSYFLKANIYLFIFGFWGNYAGSEYFFDLLGMVYNFPNATTTLDTALIGSGKQPVPLIMYMYTHAYFMTYHVRPHFYKIQEIENGAVFWATILASKFAFLIYCWEIIFKNVR